MKKILIVVMVVIVVVVMGLCALWKSPNGMYNLMYLLSPDHDFDPTLAAQAPNYTDVSAWAALPEKTDPADLVPEGVLAGDQTGLPAAVFFIHPTAYLHSASWNSPLESDTATEENTLWMMANQASAYNSFCDVYAPYFREASIHAFNPVIGDNGGKALDFAYRDVARAFDYFIEHQAKGRPFIVATHSQGTVHGLRLLKEKIDNTPLYDRMIVAYLVGCTIPADVFGQQFRQIKGCNGPDDLQCVNAWDTYGEGGELGETCPHFIDGGYTPRESKPLCTNPLSWMQGDTRVDASRNKGAVPITGVFNIRFWGKDLAKGRSFSKLEAPLPNHTWAQCVEGVLFVEDQSEGPFKRLALGKNYHGLDYALFYMNIAENTRLRVNTWLEKKENTSTLHKDT